MAFSRALLISLLFSFVFLNLLQMIAGGIATTPAPSPKASTINCPAACQYRCSKSWKPEMCNKMCMICCSKCSCVPPGPAASRNVCSCYANLRNSKTGAYKCP